MIPTIIAIIFILMVFALFWYIFRSIKIDDENPIWGNLFASFLNGCLCLVLAYSFLTGNIMDLNVVENASYTVSYPSLDASTAQTINSNIAATRQYRLNGNGGGMYTIVALDSMPQANPYIANFTVSYLTKDIVYLQIQDMPLMYLFGFLTCVNFAIFAWFAWPILTSLFGMRDETHEETPPPGHGEG